MSNGLLLAISMSACLVSGMINKYYSSIMPSNSLCKQLYNAVGSVVACVIFLLWGGIQSVSPFTLALGAVFGIVTAANQIFFLKALSIGPWSYTSVITVMSMIIPSLSGMVIWDETVKWSQWVGIALLVVTLILSVDTSGEKKKASLKWLMFCMLTFLCGGSIGIMQKWHQSTDFAGELNAFLIIAFAASFIYSAVNSAIMYKKADAEVKSSVLKAVPIACMAMGGVCVAVNNKLNLHLSGVMDSAVFFPLVNGGGLILTLLAALIIFKEKLAKRQWFGVAVGIVAVAFLCNPF